MQKQKLQSGFTLIEIIVATGIITLLVSLSYAGYATFSQRQKLISAGQNLKNILRDIQSRNFNGEVDCDVCNCDDPTANILNGWVVDLSTQKQFYGQCGSNNFNVTDLNLPDDVVVESSSQIIRFISNPLRVDSDNDINICLSLSGISSRFYRITVSRSGDISDSGGLIESCQA